MPRRNSAELRSICAKSSHSLLRLWLPIEEHPLSRYGPLQGRALLPERLPELDDEAGIADYDDVMRGGLPDDRYLIF